MGDNASASAQRSVNIRTLLWLYAIMPVSFAVVCVDSFVFEHQLKDVLPENPHMWVWFSFFFNLPHIMASHISFADSEYIHAYKSKLLWSYIASVVICTGVPFIFGFGVFLVVAAFFTMHHFVKQQYGLALMFLGCKPDRFYIIWEWFSIIATSLLYVSIFGGAYVARLVPMLENIAVLLSLAAGCAGAIAYFSVLRGAHTSQIARYYMGANVLMCFLTAALFHMHYVFFAVLIPRFVHDITAVIIYSVHDANRNRETEKNIIYKWLHKIPLSPLYLCAPLAISISYVINSTGVAIATMVMWVFAFAHYILEGYTWKKGTLHRQNVPFKVT